MVKVVGFYIADNVQTVPRVATGAGDNQIVLVKVHVLIFGK